MIYCALIKGVFKGAAWHRLFRSAPGCALCECWHGRRWTVTPKSTSHRRTLPLNSSVNTFSQYGLIHSRLGLPLLWSHRSQPLECFALTFSFVLLGELILCPSINILWLGRRFASKVTDGDFTISYLARDLWGFLPKCLTTEAIWVHVVKEAKHQTPAFYLLRVFWMTF